MLTPGELATVCVVQLTKQVVSGERIEDPGCSDQVTHGGRDAGEVDPYCHKWRPNIDVSQETVVSLEKITDNQEQNREMQLDYIYIFVIHKINIVSP